MHKVGRASIIHGRFHGPHGGQTSEKQTLSKTCKRKRRRDLRADYSQWDLYAAKQIYRAIEASLSMVPTVGLR